MLKLYHLDRSPFGWKIRIVLDEKQIPHETIVPRDKAVDPEFGRLNPYRLTPVLVLEDGRSIYESTVIAEYLEERFPEPPMLPTDLWERARIRMLEDTTDQYLQGAIREYRSALFDYDPPRFRPKPPVSADPGKADAAASRIHEHLARLDAELQGRTWFGGDLFSLADAALVGPLTGALPMFGFLPDPRYPRVAAWADRIALRPSCRRSAPREPMRIER